MTVGSFLTTDYFLTFFRNIFPICINIPFVHYLMYFKSNLVFFISLFFNSRTSMCHCMFKIDFIDAHFFQLIHFLDFNSVVMQTYLTKIRIFILKLIVILSFLIELVSNHSKLLREFVSVPLYATSSLLKYTIYSSHKFFQFRDLIPNHLMELRGN